MPAQALTMIKSLVRNIPTDKTWPKERDKLGGKSNAVGSVNVSKGLAKFHQRFDAEDIGPAREAVALLQKDLTKYAKDAKKSFPKVSAYVEKAILASLEKIDELLTEEPAKLHKEIAAELKSLKAGRDDAGIKLDLKDVPNDRKDEFRRERKACVEAVTAAQTYASQLGDGWPDMDEWDRLQKAAQGLLHAFSKKWAPILDVEPDFEDAEEHWRRCVVPGLIGQLNELFAVGFGTQVELAKNDAEAAMDELCAKLRVINDRKFDPMTHGTPEGPKQDGNRLFTELITAGRKLLGDAIAEVAKGKGEKDTRLLRWRLPVQAPQNKPLGKKVDIQSQETTGEIIGEGSAKLAERVNKAKSFKELGHTIDAQGYFPHHNHFTIKVTRRWNGMLKDLDNADQATARRAADAILNEADEVLPEKETDVLKKALRDRLTYLINGLLT